MGVESGPAFLRRNRLCHIQLDWKMTDALSKFAENQIDISIPMYIYTYSRREEM